MAQVRKRFLEGHTKEDRKKQRQALGPLRGLTVSEKTQQRYTQARSKFYDFLSHNGLELPHRRDKFDPLLSEYIEHLWSEGEGRGLASDTVAGLQDLDPKLRGQLPQTWRLLKTWHVQEVPNRAPPLLETALFAMVGWSFFHGHVGFGLSLLLGFYGMLRTGELLGLKSNDMSMSGPKSVTVISLGLTKSGKRVGAAESVTITSGPALKWLWQWKEKNKPKTFLCPRTMNGGVFLKPAWMLC